MEKFSIRYIVVNVEEAIAFYVEKLGFEVDMHPAPSFAALSKGSMQLFINQPGTGGAGQALPDGSVPAPGGWNRFRLEVHDLPAKVRDLKNAGCSFRGETIIGRGGSQALLQDPSGNLIELFEARNR
jgi:catechol 2,3-dioxygenase-like lactoylglutathione lyase family enzyme